MHNAAMAEYFPGRNFGKAARMFEEVGRALANDFASPTCAPGASSMRRTRRPRDWDGVEIMKSK